MPDVGDAFSDGYYWSDGYGWTDGDATVGEALNPMAIQTYADLIGAIGGWLARADLTQRNREAVALFENTVRQKWRIEAMETEIDFVIDAERMAPPAGYLSMTHGGFYIPGTPHRSIDFLSKEAFRKLYRNGCTGQPRHFTKIAGKLVFGPAPDATYTAYCCYYKAPDFLSDDTQTNVLLPNYANAYLFGSLTAMEMYLQNDARVPVWASVYAKIEQDILSGSNADRHSGSAMYSGTSPGYRE